MGAGSSLLSLVAGSGVHAWRFASAPCACYASRVAHTNACTPAADLCVLLLVGARVGLCQFAQRVWVSPHWRSWRDLGLFQKSAQACCGWRGPIHTKGLTHVRGACSGVVSERVSPPPTHQPASQPTHPPTNQPTQLCHADLQSLASTSVPATHAAHAIYIYANKHFRHLRVVIDMCV